MESVRIFAPATVANVACGFDIFGLAVDQPGDEVILTKRNDDKIVITEITGDQGKLTFVPEKNTVSLPIIRFLESVSTKQGFDIQLHKKMPLGSGLGSSSASAVAGVFGANLLLDSPLSTRDLLPFSMEGERVACGSAHADNVGPSLLGGFVVIRSYDPLDIIQLPTPIDLYASIVHPQIEVNTKDARRILEREITLGKTITQMGNVAGLVAGLLTADYELIGRSLVDVIVEPARSILIPQFQEVKAAALGAGALGCSISGSGPSIFMLSETKEIADKVAENMQKIYNEIGIENFVYVSKINDQGIRIV